MIVDDENDYHGTIDRAMAELSPCVVCGKVPRPWKYGYWYINCCRRGANSLVLQKCIDEWNLVNDAADWAEDSVIKGEAT